MAKVKVVVDRTIGRSVFIDTKATEGATLGTNLFLPGGAVGTPSTVRQWLGLAPLPPAGVTAPPSGGTDQHRLLQGLTVGNDHPQYTRRDILTTQGDLYVRGATVIERLGVGAEGTVLKIVGGIPAWATDERGVEEVIGTYGEIDVDSTDPAAPIVSLAPEILDAVDLALSAVQPADIVPILDATFLTESDETATFPNSRRLSAGTNITFDTSTPGVLEINATGGGGGGTVDSVVGTYGEIDVDDYDPANPVLSLADEVIAALLLATSAAQPGDNISSFTNDVPYLTSADLAGYVPTSRTLTAGSGLTGGGDLSADRTFDVGAGTGITVNANDVQVSAAYQALINGAIQSSVLTTDGDLLTRAAGVPARIAAGTDTYVLTMVSGAPAWAAATGGASGANPTASVGLSAVNGVATTFMRSDAAPPLDQSIAPTWTGAHQFNLPVSFQSSQDAHPAAQNPPAIFGTSGSFTTPPGYSANGGHLVLQSRSNSAAAMGVFIAAGQTGVNQTLVLGVRVGVVSVLGDNTELRFGTGGDDLAIYHDGTNNHIDLNTGDLIFGDGTNPLVRIVSGGIAMRLTGTSDASQPASRYSHYTTDFSTERGYWGYPTSASDTMILRNIVGALIQFRAAANSTRLQVDDTTGLVYSNPVNYTGSVTPEVGFRLLPQNIQNGNYTAVLGDSACHIYKASGGSGETITIPPNGGAGAVAYPVGTMLTFVNRGGGTLSIAITTDTLVMSPGGATGTRTLADQGVATALKVASTTWLIWGTGLS